MSYNMPDDQVVNHRIQLGDLGKVNRTMVASVVIIMATGIYHFFLTNKGASGAKAAQSSAITKILVGGFMLALFMSLFDLVGLGLDKISGALLMLAVGVAVFAIVNDLVSRQQGNKGATAPIPPSSPPGGGGGGGTKK